MTSASDYHVSWDEFHRDCRKLAELLMQEHGPELPWTGIIAIARGGLIPAAILAREFNIRLVETLCIASYDHDQQGDIQALKDVKGNGHQYLMVDDLVDTGATARAARAMLPAAHFVTVYAKPAAVELVDNYARAMPQDCWLHFPWDSGPSYQKPMLERL